MTTSTHSGKVYLTAVDQWLDSLPASESDSFKEFAEVLPALLKFGYMQESVVTQVHSMI